MLWYYPDHDKYELIHVLNHSSQEEEELRKLKERQELRKKEREEEELAFAARKAEEEEKRKIEEVNYYDLMLFDYFLTSFGMSVIHIPLMVCAFVSQSCAYYDNIIQDERRARYEAEKAKKEEEREKRQQQMAGLTGGRNFVIPEKKDKWVQATTSFTDRRKSKLSWIKMFEGRQVRQHRAG